ncbi:flavodoxin family protein [Streptomyces canus]|uniref:flavodoxin family protein n=1 Tax=Streptomyces canus TaxID=58343 RepID=UPI003248C1EF
MAAQPAPTEDGYRFDDLRALFINCTLKPSPQLSHTQGLIDKSRAIMNARGVTTDEIRAVDHDIAPGVYPDMTEHGFTTDAWPALYEKVMAADILVLAGPIWLGDNSSVTKQAIERLYSCSSLLNSQGQYAYYGRVGGCLITGNEDGVKHCAMNVLYSLQHLGYTIPPQADAGWIGAAGPGPSYLDPGSGGPENDFTNRNTSFMKRACSDRPCPVRRLLRRPAVVGLRGRWFWEWTRTGTLMWLRCSPRWGLCLPLTSSRPPRPGTAIC